MSSVLPFMGQIQGLRVPRFNLKQLIWRRLGETQMSNLQNELMSLIKILSSTSGDGEQEGAQPFPDPEGLPLVAQTILSSLDLSDKPTDPYPHFLMKDVLPAGY